MGHLYHISPQGSRLIMGRGKGMEKFSKPEVREDQIETVFSEHDWLSVHTNSERLYCLWKTKPLAWNGREFMSTQTQLKSYVWLVNGFKTKESQFYSRMCG